MKVDKVITLNWEMLLGSYIPSHLRKTYALAFFSRSSWMNPEKSTSNQAYRHYKKLFCCTGTVRHKRCCATPCNAACCIYTLHL